MRHNGKYGEFIGCSNFPMQIHTENLIGITREEC